MSAPIETTTHCRCWRVVRRDGRTFGFTDHDCDLVFGGVSYRADTGLTAQALSQVNGLAVDNTEAMGALSDEAITEADIKAGRFDGAEVTAALVDWTRPEDTAQTVFKGTIGEVRRGGGAFHAELRGLSEALNRPIGKVYQKPCSALLGDDQCKADLNAAGYRVEIAVELIEDARILRFEQLAGFDDRWFERGKLDVLSGEAEGLTALIKNDRVVDGTRVIELWEGLRAAIVPGDQIRLTAGCDKRVETCRLKFQNLANYRGFPHVPGDDWLMTYPRQSQPNTGGSLFS